MPMDLEFALADAKDELATAKDELRALSDRIAALQAECRGIELAVARHKLNGHAPTLDVEKLKSEQPVTPKWKQRIPDAALAFLAIDQWRRLSQAKAVEQVVRAAGNPVHRLDITQALHSVGRSDSADDVSAALSYLRRKGVVRSLGHGQWALADTEVSSQVASQKD